MSRGRIWITGQEGELGGRRLLSSVDGHMGEELLDAAHVAGAAYVIRAWEVNGSDVVGLLLELSVARLLSTFLPSSLTTSDCSELAESLT